MQKSRIILRSLLIVATPFRLLAPIAVRASAAACMSAVAWCGVATISRLLEIVSLFGRISSLL